MPTLLTAFSQHCYRSNPLNSPILFLMSATTFDSASSDPWLEVVRQKVASIRFGSVQVTVHDGRVTQVESLEKTRFSTTSDDPGDAARKPRRS